MNRELHIKVFGMLADITGSSELNFTYVPDTKELKYLLEQTYPALSRHTYHLAVNHRVQPETYSIQPNDQIALLPPFSGG